ncbi:MAG: hypothetical protein P4L22_04740 [Candidatus Babeliales bacterium]|nr:hypothetical protein [Candidatus Babeliales bacterium]
MIKNKLILSVLLFPSIIQCSESPVEMPLDRVELNIMQKIEALTLRICDFFGFNQKNIIKDVEAKKIERIRARMLVCGIGRYTLARRLFVCWCITVMALRSILLADALEQCDKNALAVSKCKELINFEKKWLTQNLEVQGRQFGHSEKYPIFKLFPFKSETNNLKPEYVFSLIMTLVVLKLMLFDMTY